MEKWKAIVVSIIVAIYAFTSVTLVFTDKLDQYYGRVLLGGFGAWIIVVLVILYLPGFFKKKNIG